MGTTQKVKVDVLGKGQETITVEKAQTIGELRNLLALDPDVQAIDEQGRELSDDTKVLEAGDLTFMPNVEGGNQ